MEPIKCIHDSVFRNYPFWLYRQHFFFGQKLFYQFYCRRRELLLLLMTYIQTQGRTPLSQRPLPTRHTKNTRDKYPCPQSGFFLNFFSCSLFVLFPHLFLCLECPGLLLCLYCTIHNTNTNAVSGIRSSKPRKRAATDLSLRPRSHRSRHVDETNQRDNVFVM